jgi:hypothetical protein
MSTARRLCLFCVHDAAGSVITPEFRDRYAKHGSTGDALAKRLKRHITADDGSVDLVKLKTLAKANNIWNDRYAALNAGLARMTICSNRLHNWFRLAR